MPRTRRRTTLFGVALATLALGAACGSDDTTAATTPTTTASIAATTTTTTTIARPDVPVD